MKPIFSLSGIEKRYGSRTALCIERLQLVAGRLYCLTGPNGAGKSTLLSLLALLESPCRGKLAIDGRPLPDRGASRRQLQRQITLVHQSPFLLSGSVGRNIRYGLKLRGLNRREQNRRLLWALQTVGLAGFAHRRARALSGGEQRRVALARALALKPKILLLDEPMTGLDSRSSANLERILDNLRRQGLTIILSTHDDTLAARLAGDEIRLRDGRLVGETPANSERSYPALTESTLCLNPLKMQEA
ncbi:MAG: ABC transporter ATP-binding protein [Desulfuromonadales bacterium]|nr:ABC transporter ATP-binding protein [Desulfuromonadales bacterium]NIR34472.1 ABC transporter ATP-binding protein [Desulfuromonadales bacterium]NIS44299.1 ABC transporter ATP-binding protein [Desulfuromonadales bacterium]